MKQVRVSAKRDYLETLATTKQPLTGVAELIWNGLDADALNVSVSLVQNGIHGIESIVVEDNGNGIPNNEAELAFGNLGGSWKTHKRRTEVFKRSLHGKSGKGRFRAFALGNRIEWQTRYKNNGSIAEYTIIGAHQSDRPEWMLHDDAQQRITIWIKPWDLIIEDCRARLNFYQEKLRYAADLDSARVYLQKTHEKYLPDVFKQTEKAS